MTQFVIRFSGRFVVAHDVRANKISLLGLNVTYNKEIEADQHRVLLIAARQTVADGSRSPHMALIEPGLIGGRPDLAVWDLANWRVRPQIGGRLEWSESEDDVEVANLNDVEPLCPFDVQHLQQFGESRPVIAIIDIEAGKVGLGQINRARYVFARPREAPPGPMALGQRLAELLEVTFSLPGDEAQLTVDLSLPDGTRDKLVFDGHRGTPTIVTVSNLCGSGQASGGIDREFAAAYEVLKNPPAVPDRRVPVLVLDPKYGFRFPCYKLAYVQVPDETLRQET